VALSQHGTVAPITIHHRVDFAASMVDGRTVGEVIPDSPSAKEITELWIYIQDRLARLVKDPTLAPEARPDYFSITSLSGGSETVDVVDHASQPEDMQALNAKLRESYTPPAPAPVAALPRAELEASASFSSPVQAAQAAPSTHEVQRPEFGARKALPKARDASRGTLFGGAGRQTNTFGRRNWD
jgi:chromosome partitioning protein